MSFDCVERMKDRIVLQLKGAVASTSKHVAFVGIENREKEQTRRQQKKMY